MTIQYTIIDEDEIYEEEIVGTLSELDEYFSGYCIVMDWCDKIEVCWDYGWDDGPHYGYFTIIKREELK